MTHDEFVEKAMDAGIFEEASEIRRISTERALIPASWMGRILDAIPEAGDYLRDRSPEAWAQYEQAMERRKELIKMAMSEVGKVKSAKKAAASRENGRKGGRPRKPKPSDNQ